MQIKIKIYPALKSLNFIDPLTWTRLNSDRLFNYVWDIDFIHRQSKNI